MSVTAPPRPPHPSDPVDRDELEALIEEARRRARRRRILYAAVAGNRDVYVMNADGSRQRNLTGDIRQQAFGIAWMPTPKR